MTRHRVYQYCLKRPMAPIAPARHNHPFVDEALRRRAADLTAAREELFDFELYLVVLADRAARRLGKKGSGLGAAERVRAGLSRTGTVAWLETQLTEEVARLRHSADAFAVHLSDVVRPEPLDKRAAFAFFRRLLNYTEWKAEAARLKYDGFLDVFVADSSLECHRDHLQMDEMRIRVLTMKEPPARTFAHILQDLTIIPTSFICCLEWKRRDTAAVRREIHGRRRHFFNRRVSMVNYLSSQSKNDEVLVDESASAIVRELGESLTDLDVHGYVFGECSWTLVLYDRDKERLDRSVAASASSV